MILLPILIMIIRKGSANQCFRTTNAIQKIDVIIELIVPKPIPTTINNNVTLSQHMDC